MKPTAGALLLLAPLLAAQAWLWPLGVRAAGSGRLCLPERHEWSENVNSRSRVRYDWIPLEKADAVRTGWGIQAAAAVLGIWSAAVMLHGRRGWKAIRRPIALASALLCVAALILLLPPWKARAFSLAGGCWAFVMLVGAVELVSGPVKRRFGRRRMQALNCLAGGGVLVASAAFFGWNAFWGGVVGIAVLGLGSIHAGVLRTAPGAASAPFPGT